MLNVIKVRQIKIDVREDSKENLKNKLLKKLRTEEKHLIDFKIIKKSIDARDKNSVYYVYEVNASLDSEDIILNLRLNDVEKTIEEKYQAPVKGSIELLKRPVIVGSGPAGLFCALILAENGYKPLIIERGEKVEERTKSVEKFWNESVLNPNSNVCFGEGGAGTFSDGKLNTLIKDSSCYIRKVYESFVECGANEDILYVNKPHIGTDVLRTVLINIRNKIESLGGEYLFNTTLTDIKYSNNNISSIIVNDKQEIETDVLILALGHSAKDTIKMLYRHGIEMESKPFAVGVRIQHRQDMINNSQYGEFSRYLPAASYKLTYKASNNRGVYTFCMCPGGYVVNSSSEQEHLLVNGMSNHNRDSENANSAVIVTVNQDDFGYNPMKALEFQEELESKAYKICDGDIPTQLYKDYKDNKKSNHFGIVNPLFKGNYSFANINDIFPDYINESLKEAIEYFNTKIKGFSMDDAIISAVESRTSSAIRINRDENYETKIKGIYSIGEGAGYSGGITTSAVDGIKAAEKIINKYSNKTL